MITLVPLLLLCIVIGVAWAVGQRRTSRGRLDPMPSSAAIAPPADDAATETPLARSLTVWQEAGLISAAQAADIEAFELAATAATMAPARPAPRVPVVAEALGYLGGTLGIVGLVLLVTKYWPDLATPARLAIAASAAIVLTVAGYMVPSRDEPAFERLRSFVWLGATAAGALTAGVVAVDVFDATFAPTVALACAATVAVHSGSLWASRYRPVQQATCLVGLMVTVGTATAQFAEGGPIGVALACAGLLLLIAGLYHRTTVPSMTIGVGAATALIGAGTMTSEWRSVGVIVLLLTACGLLALAATDFGPLRTEADRTVLTVVGAIGMMQAIPANIQHWGEEAGIITGVTMWLAGASLLWLAGRPAVHTPTVMRLAGGAALVAGAAVTGLQSVAFATLFGLLTAVGLIVLGTYPGQVLMSLFGSIGLLVNVPWAIRYYFPGEGRVPLLILVSGVLIVGVAVWLTRMGGEIRHQFHFHHH